MNSPTESKGRSNDVRRLIVSVSLSAAALTLLFTAQQIMRRNPNGPPVDLLLALRVNALDWGSWGLLVPFIVFVGRRFRLDGGGNRIGRAAVWIALGFVSTTVQSIVAGLVLRAWRVPGLAIPGPGAPLPPLGRYLSNWIVSGVGFNMIIFLMIAGVFHATLYYRDLRARQLREIDLEARLARSELNVLRMQIQPHFFFNALHTISSLMVSDVPTAHRVIAALGDLLRSSLDHTARQEIPLREELTFVERYLEIQQARFRARLAVEIEIPTPLLDALVPGLVLQPLVENAIRHGIESHTKRGTIWIRAERRADKLLLTVRDDGSLVSDDAPPSLAPSSSTSGIGLANIESRLAQLYGASHTFSAGRASDGHFEVALTLPFHREAGLFPAAQADR